MTGRAIRMAIGTALLFMAGAVARAETEKPYRIRPGRNEGGALEFRIVSTGGWQPKGRDHSMEVRESSELLLAQDAPSTARVIRKEILFSSPILPLKPETAVRVELTFTLADPGGNAKTFTETVNTRLVVADDLAVRAPLLPGAKFLFRGVEWLAPKGAAPELAGNVVVVSLPEEVEAPPSRDRVRRLLAGRSGVIAVELVRPDAVKPAADPKGQIHLARGRGAHQIAREMLGSDTGLVVLDKERRIAFIGATPPRGGAASVEDAVVALLDPSLAAKAATTGAPALAAMAPEPEWSLGVPVPVGAVLQSAPGSEVRGTSLLSYTLEGVGTDELAHFFRHAFEAAGMKVTEQREAPASGVPGFLRITGDSPKVYPRIRVSAQSSQQAEQLQLAPDGKSWTRVPDGKLRTTVTVSHESRDPFLPGVVAAPTPPPDLPIPLAPDARMVDVRPGAGGRSEVFYSTSLPFDEVVAFLDNRAAGRLTRGAPTIERVDADTTTPFDSRAVAYKSAKGDTPIDVFVRSRPGYVSVVLRYRRPLSLAATSWVCTQEAGPGYYSQPVALGTWVFQGDGRCGRTTNPASSGTCSYTQGGEQVSVVVMNGNGSRTTWALGADPYEADVLTGTRSTPANGQVKAVTGKVRCKRSH